MRLFGRKKPAPVVAPEKLPRHIAIIMDGNGRWAKRRGLPRNVGHSAGAETFRRIATHCKHLGLEYLTVYAFSTENWRRPPEEVEAIMRLLETYLLEAIEKMEKEGIRLKILGDEAPLSPRLRELIARTDALSAGLEGFEVNLCLNYGGRDVIVHAARRLCAEGQAITEESLADALYTGGIPDPELIIRPGGEMRLSNFLLWQAAYSELVFTDTLWPDFTERELDQALAAYARRERRFGGVQAPGAK